MTDKPAQLIGAQLLLADARTAFLLANYARRRAIIRAFGVAPEHVNAVTAAGLVLIAGSIHETVVPRIRRSVPTPSDAVLGAGMARSLLGAIAGPTIDEMPGIGGLIALALLVHGTRPTLIRSAQALRTGTKQLAHELHQLSDYLLGR